MGDETAIVKADSIGLVPTDKLSHDEKFQIVLKYISEYLAEFNKDADSFLELSKNIRIRNMDDLKNIVSVRETCRERLNSIDGFQDDYLRPPKREIKTAEALLNTPKKKFDEAMDNLDELIRENYILEEDGRLAAQNALNANKQISTTSFIPDVELPPTEKTIRADDGRAVTIKNGIEVKVKSLQEVVDACANHELPYCILSVDEGAAKKYFAVHKLKTAPGFIIKDKPVVSGRK